MLIEVLSLLVGAGLAAYAVRAVADQVVPAAPSEDRPTVPDQVERIVRAVTLASTAGDVHLHLRPLLRAVALERLLSRGVAIDASQSPARTLLGEPLWDIVRADRPPPRDAFAPGLTAHALDALLDRLEAL
jgi:hypothetical protein